MNKKAIIFDLDGVIVDTAKYHFIAWQKIAGDLGITFTKKDNEKLKGVSRVKSLDIILDLGQIQLTETEKEALLTQKNEHYLSLIAHMNKDELLPGIYDLLQDLYQSGIPLALGSASKNARRILDALQLTDKFSAIIDGTDVSKAKPDPEVFLKAAEKLGFKPEDCIVIEDSQAGIQAANAVNMISVGIGSATDLTEADYVLPTTGLLTKDFLLNLKKQN